MGLFKFKRRDREQQLKRSRKARRIGHFERVEPRRVMTASPVSLGAVYVEEDLGSDNIGDTFHISFQGGAQDSELSRVVIDTDRNQDGFGVGDAFFDTVGSGLGADHAFDFTIVSLQTQDPTASVTASVSDAGTELVLDFRHFVAGDTLVFSIDVDEAQDYDPTETDISIINEDFDPITSGVEFQGSHLQATFVAPHFRDISGQAEFRNRYDHLLDGRGLDLPADDFQGKRDRTAGAAVQVQQVPKPVTISGSVFIDNNRNLQQDTNDAGLSQVQLSLWHQLNNTYVDTGIRTTTNDLGNYAFGESLDLSPGTYQVREAQPPGLFSVGAIPGSVAGAPVGTDLSGDPNILTGIALPLGDLHAVNYDFAEVAPAELHGRVHLTDESGDCFGTDSVAIQNARVLLFDAAGTKIAETTTDATGEYHFTQLFPDTYSVVELTPSGLLDGGEHVGTVDGVSSGRIDGIDSISRIVLGSGQIGREYNFCEHEPSSLSGFVYHDEDNNGAFTGQESPIEGVTLDLLDGTGQAIATTFTNAQGYYEFSNLRGGVYRLVEQQPSGWIDGIDTAGTVDQQPTGVAVGSDEIAQIQLGFGQDGVQFNFGELLAGSLRGLVHIDLDQDCEVDPGEAGLEGVVVELLNSDGQLVASTTTDAQGQYEFTQLKPGRYGIRQVQPDGFFHGGQRVGSHGGTVAGDDLLSNIEIGSGQHLVDYNFCEVPPTQISGTVFLDSDLDVMLGPDEPRVPGVIINLLDAQGQVVATTTTDSQGEYRFENLRPGKYGVQEIQPSDLIDGGQKAGSGGGDASQFNRIDQIMLPAGADLVNYNFAEILPGIISGYVFQDGPVIQTIDGQPPENLSDIRDGLFTGDDTPISGVQITLINADTGLPASAADMLPGVYGSGAIQVSTGSNGYYEFRGLRPGLYTVVEQQPANYIDSIDTPGTTGGHADTNDTLADIPLQMGQHSSQNNFSEVLVGSLVQPPINIPPAPPIVLDTFNPAAFVPPLPPLPLPQLPPSLIPRYWASPTISYTWHLSIIDAGMPRGVRPGSAIVGADALIPVAAWDAEQLAAGQFEMIVSTQPDEHRFMVFGVAGGVPVAGDFDGDGITEVGVYFRGQWYLDLNGNGRWDDEDLWAKLGEEDDLPVTGDWNGDGKDDIGIFGRAWAGDPRAIANEPGLPDAQNVTTDKRMKNVPPKPGEATDGSRHLQRTRQGPARSDIIDHVFQYGDAPTQPVTGDWNGDGVTSIGVFHDGVWQLDTNGNGRIDKGDLKFTYGKPGDRAVVGDFNADDIDEVGVFRDGRWITDSNQDRVLDATDRVFELGGKGDIPIVGDWDGDGVDDPAIYKGQRQSGEPIIQAAKPGWRRR